MFSFLGVAFVAEAKAKRRRGEERGRGGELFCSAHRVLCLALVRRTHAYIYIYVCMYMYMYMYTFCSLANRQLFSVPSLFLDRAAIR